VAELHVELVSVEREVWSGEASQVTARTTEGEIGILPGHAPLLGQLADGGTVTVYESGGERVVAAVHGGFLSVTDDGVTILGEVAEMATDIDAGRARTALDRARSEQDLAAQHRAESRLRAVGESV
jgi:F-type H+-transporting ATPase subunit epsilon